MSLFEITERYNNLKKIDDKNVPEELLKNAIKTLQEELISKVENIIEYRKNLLQEQKTKKLIEIDEYIQYCLLIANIEKIITSEFELKIIKPIESIQHQEKVLIVKERYNMNLNKKDMEIIKNALAYYVDNCETIAEGEEWKIEDLWGEFNDRIEEIEFNDYLDSHSEEELIKKLDELED